MYCSNDVPIPPAHLHSAYTDNMGQLTKAWGGDTAPGPPRAPQALDAAIRFAAQFTYDDPPSSHPLTSAFMHSQIRSPDLGPSDAPLLTHRSPLPPTSCRAGRLSHYVGPHSFDAPRQWARSHGSRIRFIFLSPIEETSVIARTSRTCLNIWAGDHRQTPGGLKNTVECRLFRQKLLQRPLALRCGTDYVQPHEMYRIRGRYLDGPWGSPSHQLKALLEDVDSNPYESGHMTAVTQLWCEIFGNERVWLDTVVCATCFAILWLALKGEGVSSPIATTLDAAAGLAQRQKWGLILPSSARVSKLTYQTVIGVRYPELVRPTTNGWQYGRYVSAEATFCLYFGMCQKVLCTLSVMLVRW